MDTSQITLFPFKSVNVKHYAFSTHREYSSYGDPKQKGHPLEGGGSGQMSGGCRPLAPPFSQLRMECCTGLQANTPTVVLYKIPRTGVQMQQESG